MLLRRIHPLVFVGVVPFIYGLKIHNLLSYKNMYFSILHFLIFCCWFPICWPHSTWFTCCSYPIFSFFCFCAAAKNTNFWVISTQTTFSKSSVCKPNSGGQFRCFHYIGTYKASKRQESSEPISSVVYSNLKRGSHIEENNCCVKRTHDVW